jgi:hypothetical protein
MSTKDKRRKALLASEYDAVKRILGCLDWILVMRSAAEKGEPAEDVKAAVLRLDPDKIRGVYHEALVILTQRYDAGLAASDRVREGRITPKSYAEAWMASKNGTVEQTAKQLGLKSPRQLHAWLKKNPALRRPRKKSM